jgi:hypothetical protein
MTDAVTYPDRTGTGTLELVRTKSILVISPWVLVALLAIAGLVGGWRLRRRFRRARQG